jgi:ABC-type sugar transport system substrate-binding protein
MKKFPHLAMLILVFSTTALSAQSSGSPSGSPARQEPCWKQAGITRPVMEQRRAIERDAHSQIAAVCENSSLTPQQKQEQAHEIRQQEQQKVDAIVTPEQQSAIRSCQQQRGRNGGANEGHHPGGSPCGNFGASQGRQGPANGNTGGTPQTPEN